MKINYQYVVLISILVSIEIIIFLNSQTGFRDIKLFVFRELVTVVLAVWYYREQGYKLDKTQKKFLITILIPLALGFTRYLIPDDYATKVNTFFYFVIYVLWMSIIHSLGARFNKYRFPRTYYLLIPIVFCTPILYFFMVLFPMLDTNNKVLSFLFALFASSKSVFVLFLPPIKNSSGRNLIILGVWFSQFTNMMQSYFYFNSDSLFIYPFARILQTTSTVILIIGMTHYLKNTSKIPIV